MSNPKLFLIGHEKDAAAANQLRERFVKEGFGVWSERDLTPGDLIVEEQERALADSDGGVVLVSSHSLEAWQSEQLQVLLRRASQRKRFVVPVLTGPSVKLWGFLQAREPGSLEDLDAVVLGIRKKFTGVHERSARPGLGKNGRLRTNLTSFFRLVGRTDEIAALETWFEDTSRPAMGVFHGPPGTGKSGLGEWWGATHLHQYPGGVFRVSATTSLFDGLVRVAEQVFKMRAEDFQKGGPLSLFEPFAEAPTLLIFDNLPSADGLILNGEKLLPRLDQPIHVLATSVATTWPQGFKKSSVGPLSEATSRALVRVLDDPATLDKSTEDLVVQAAAGYPAVLVPLVESARRYAKYGRPFRASAGTKVATKTTGQLFRPVWDTLDAAKKALLCAAACLRAESIPERLLQTLSGESDLDRFDETLISLCERRLLEVERFEAPQRFRMAILLKNFVRAQPDCAAYRERADKERASLAPRIDRDPAPDDAADMIALLPEDPADATPELLVAGSRALSAAGLFEEGLRWSLARPGELEQAWADCCEVEAVCLVALGRFPEAKSAARELVRVLDQSSEWANAARRGRARQYLAAALIEEAAFSEAIPTLTAAITLHREGDAAGVDHDSVGSCLHPLGFCYSEQGEFEEAQPIYEEAAGEKRRGDLKGRVDHRSVAASINQAAVCLSERGRHAEARPLYQEAAAEGRKGDAHGRVDHELVSISVHQAAMCLTDQGNFELALPEFEEAASECRQGDIYGRVSHDGVGRSVHQVGFCLSALDRVREALQKYEEATRAKRRGDVHGRVDHDSVGTSLHQVAFCLFAQEDFELALPRFEEAADEARKGDIHGRVDHSSVSSSMHQAAACLARQEVYADALPRYEVAVVEGRQGDRHGRVDHGSVGRSLNQVGICHERLDNLDEAVSAFEDGVNEKLLGDVHGRVNWASVGLGQHQVGWCHLRSKDYAVASSWFERAIESRRKGDTHKRVDHTGIASSLSQLGVCSYRLGNPETALRQLQEAADEHGLGDLNGHVNTKDLALAQSNAAQVLDELGRADEAAEWRAKAAASEALASNGAEP